MLAVLNLGVLLRESSVVMVIGALHVVPHIYQGTVHGHLPHDEVLTTSPFPYHESCSAARLIAVAAHHNVAVYHPSIFAARTVPLPYWVTQPHTSTSQIA
jgi:hypothetical protein